MNMKKFLTVFVLGLAIFAVSCSTTDEDLFLQSLDGKSGTLKYNFTSGNNYETGNTYVSFTDGGKKFTDSEFGGSFTFVEVINSTKASYTGTINDYTYAAIVTYSSGTMRIEISGVVYFIEISGNI